MPSGVRESEQKLLLEYICLRENIDSAHEGETVGGAPSEKQYQNLHETETIIRELWSNREPVRKALRDLRLSVPFETTSWFRSNFGKDA